jgi:hypothetical protein
MCEIVTRSLCDEISFIMIVLYTKFISFHFISFHFIISPRHNPALQRRITRGFLYHPVIIRLYSAV